MQYVVEKIDDIDEKTKRELIVTALLHDLGKSMWPDELFTKPSYLLKVEDIALIKTHTILTRNLLKENVGELLNENILKFIENHHEKPGGKGYPAGLVEPGYPVRILEAVDIFCATLLEERAYRTGKENAEGVFMEIEELAGKKVSKILKELYQKLFVTADKQFKEGVM